MLTQHDKKQERLNRSGGKNVVYGTPLFEGEQENRDALKQNNLNKYAPQWQQYAVNEKGQKRFHGAFTGGFSAGYFNTVGSKQGFMPKNYSSGTKQTVMDYMDDEDLEELTVNPVQTKSQFKQPTTRSSSSTSFVERTEADNSHLNALFGGIGDTSSNLTDAVPSYLPNNLIATKPNISTIGVTLLKKMGWTEGHAIGEKRVKRKQKAKVYGVTLPPHLQKKTEDEVEEVVVYDTSNIMIHPKHDLHGIGYSPQSIESKSSTQKASNRIHMRSENTTADIDLSEYDIELSRAKRSREVKNIDSYRISFAVALEPYHQHTKLHPPPVVPKDFIPIHSVESVEKTDTANRIALSLNSSTQRGSVLGEPAREQEFNAEDSFWSYLKPEDRIRIQAIAKRNLALHDLQQSEIQERKEKIEINRKTTPLFESAQTKELRERLTSAMAQRFTKGVVQDMNKSENSQKQYGLSSRFTTASDTKQQSDTSSSKSESQIQPQPKQPSRQTLNWYPEALLCKRLGVPNNFANQPKKGTQRIETKKSASIFDDNLFQVSNESSDSGAIDRKAVNEEEPVVHEEKIVTTARPAMDIFRSVFEDDDDDQEPAHQTAPVTQQKKQITDERDALLDIVSSEVPTTSVTDLIKNNDEEDNGEEDDAFPFAQLKQKREQQTPTAVQAQQFSKPVIDTKQPSAAVYTPVYIPQQTKQQQPIAPSPDDNSKSTSKISALESEIASLKKLLGENSSSDDSSDDDRSKKKRRKKDKKRKRKSRRDYSSDSDDERRRKKKKKKHRSSSRDSKHRSSSSSSSSSRSRDDYRRR
jgi:G patch domain-containing protein 1